MTKRYKWVEVRIPVLIEDGDQGLCYGTSPLINGLLVAEHSEQDVLTMVPAAVDDLACAVTDEQKSDT